MIWGRWLEWFPELLSGLGASLGLTALVSLIGFPLGLVLGVLSTVRNGFVRGVVIAGIELFRGIPLLVLMFMIYFGLPGAGITLTAVAAVVIGHALNIGAYSSEVFRAGLLHVGSAQREAAASLGIAGHRAFVWVVLPQALRAVLGPLTSLLIMVFQSTSLAFAIGVRELTSRAFSIGSMTFQYFNVLVLAGLMYAVLCVVAARVVSGCERKLQANSR